MNQFSALMFSLSRAPCFLELSPGLILSRDRSTEAFPFISAEIAPTEATSHFYGADTSDQSPTLALPELLARIGGIDPSPSPWSSSTRSSPGSFPATLALVHRNLLLDSCHLLDLSSVGGFWLILGFALY